MVNREMLYFNAPLPIATLILMTRRLVFSFVGIIAGCYMFTVKDDLGAYTKFVDIFASTLIIEPILCIVVESLAIHGVRYRIPCLLMLWIIFNSIIVSLYLLIIVSQSYAMFLPHGLSDFFSNIIISILAGFNIYETIVVQHCYKELRNGP